MTVAELLGTIVRDVLAAHPCAARVFVDRAMGCAGCPFARFETVAEVAAVYGIDPQQLGTALLEAVEAQRVPGEVTS